MFYCPLWVAAQLWSTDRPDMTEAVEPAAFKTWQLEFAGLTYEKSKDFLFGEWLIKYGFLPQWDIALLLAPYSVEAQWTALPQLRLRRKLSHNLAILAFFGGESGIMTNIEWLQLPHLTSAMTLEIQTQHLRWSWTWNPQWNTLTLFFEYVFLHQWNEANTHTFFNTGFQKTITSWCLADLGIYYNLTEQHYAIFIGCSFRFPFYPLNEHSQ